MNLVFPNNGLLIAERVFYLAEPKLTKGNINVTQCIHVLNLSRRLLYLTVFSLSINVHNRELEPSGSLMSCYNLNSFCPEAL